MALGNVNDAPVRLNALVIENARLSLPVLQERLTVHYSDEFFGQLYRVLGSADVLGCVLLDFSPFSAKADLATGEQQPGRALHKRLVRCRRLLHPAV